MSDEFDFTALSVTTTELPSQEGPGRKRKIQNNPFVKWVEESYANKVGKAVTVPNAQVKQTEYLIRQAAGDLGIGVRIVFSLDKEARDKAPKNKNVTVSFQGKDKRKYNGRNTGSGAETPVAVEATVTAETPVAGE